MPTIDQYAALGATEFDEQQTAGNTAMKRRGPSVPVQHAINQGLVAGRVLHQGAGRPDNPDRALLDSLGHTVHYDPNHSPETADHLHRADFDTVVTPYVVNVLPPQGRQAVYQDAARSVKPDGRVVIAARSHRSVKPGPGWVEHQDGHWVPNRGTWNFQRGYTPEELRDEARQHFEHVEIVPGAKEPMVVARRPRPVVQSPAGPEARYTWYADFLTRAGVSPRPFDEWRALQPERYATGLGDDQISRFAHGHCHALTAALLKLAPGGEALGLFDRRYPDQISHSVYRIPHTKVYLDAYGPGHGDDALEAKRHNFLDAEHKEWRPIDADKVLAMVPGTKHLSIKQAIPHAKALLRAGDELSSQGEPDRYRVDENRGYVAVDLDGTLARWEPTQGLWRIGEPVPEMVARVKAWLAAGKEVRIFTARVYGPDAESQRRLVDQWCRQYIGRTLPVTAQKDPGMYEFWDDRAIQVLRNTGRPVGRYSEPGTPERYADPLPQPGKFDHETLSDPGYAYHATTLDNAEGIHHRGLQTHRPWHGTDQAEWPDRSTDRRAYFTPVAGHAHSFVPEGGPPMLLRVPTDQHKFKRESTGDLYTTKPVHPRIIEALDAAGQWRPLRQFFAEPSQLLKRRVDTPEQYSMTAAEIDAAVKDWSPPTEAQIDAGNYAKPTISWKGLQIKIENPKGTRRKPEYSPLTTHYGYIVRMPT